MPDTDDLLAVALRRPREAAFVLGLHGPWGCGKTTLLYAIARGLPHSSLTIRVNAWKYQVRDALRRALIPRSSPPCTTTAAT